MDEISSRKRGNASARTVAVAVAGAILLLFGTPLRVLWMDASGSWWIVYSIWILAIGLIAVATRREP